MMSSGRRRARLRRVSSTQLAFPDNRDSLPRLEFTNARQFAALPSAQQTVLFYKDNGANESNPSVFDPELDEDLLALHLEPYPPAVFSLASYEACVTRASYECRPHPNQRAVLELVGDDVAGTGADMQALVYRRDEPGASLARNRRANPFTNTVNGCGEGRQSEPLILFSQYSFEPVKRIQIVWHREPSRNSIVGLIVVRVLDNL